ncbi:MAG TPA: triose-phosphate isomerase [Sphaerochaeta sp.]|jgi:triosephosphate isomerase|nr:triose-phosphate isomerase [Spirochaetota bacterium]NLV61494.1 triose-phosphate isomerase [Spirochaetales bacterium]HOE83844.1 triose-phosphate isomerase [Sphaerochaeta sp.]HOQ94311.1 triose-phosphate isomerase [Sphaerochaeta sp.]HPK46747.1 triose-phosphate isomerase [Sphaerochaeta sp.]
MRRPFIAGNWKMNMTPSEGAAFALQLKDALKDSKTKVMVAPPFVTIPAVMSVLKDSNIIVGAQNMSDVRSGAHTGEVSVLMLKDLGVHTVILGHSERRSLYAESDAFINRKVLLAVEEGMDVVLCIGETLAEREGGQLEEVLTRQVTEGLKGVKAEGMRQITLAYEPVWAIGTGRTATGEDADSAHAFIRGLVAKLYSQGVAEELIIQYGGSVKANNAKALMSKEHIDGALVGGASLSVEQFLPIVNFGA